MTDDDDREPLSEMVRDLWNVDPETAERIGAEITAAIRGGGRRAATATGNDMATRNLNKCSSCGGPSTHKIGEEVRYRLVGDCDSYPYRDLGMDHGTRSDKEDS